MMAFLLQVAISNLVLSVPLALVAYAVHRSQRSPTLAHLLWVLVLAKLVTPPIFSVPVVSLPNINTKTASAPIQETGAVFDIETDLATVESHDSLKVSPAAQPTRSLDSWVAFTKTGLLSLWITGSLFVLFQSLKSVFRFNQGLSNACRRADPPVQQLATEAAKQLGLRSCPEVYSVPTEIAPLVWWMGGHAKVVIPEKVEQRYQPHEIQWILAHELSHIKRRDHLVRWLEWLACVVFWWNPIAWWARRCLRANEELCCDAMVLNALQPDPQRYGLLLLSIVELLAYSGIRPPAEVCAITNGDSLERRFQMLVSMNTLAKLPQWLSGGLLVLALGLLPFGIAYGQDYDAIERRLGVAVGEGEITLSQAQAIIRALRVTSEDQQLEKRGMPAAEAETSALIEGKTQNLLTLQEAETAYPALDVSTNEEQKIEALKAAIKEQLRTQKEDLRKQLAAGEITQEEMKAKVKAAERQTWENYRKFELYGMGPNLGSPIGYYGRFNRILARIEANPELDVIRTTLHRDMSLEDFYITVRTQNKSEVRLRFEEAHTRPFSELLQELERVGMREGEAPKKPEAKKGSP